MPKGIVDQFFYEELCRVAGHEAGSQWLLSCRTKQRSLKRSISDISCSSNDCNEHERTFRRAPASPRSQPPWIDGPTTVYYGKSLHAGIDLCSGSYSANNRSFADSFSLPRTESISLERVLKNIASHSPPPLINSKFQTMGLIFTDAAHTVLD
jgi:hypothetical protein